MKKILLAIAAMVLLACQPAQVSEQEWYVVTRLKYVHHTIAEDKYYVYLKSLKTGEEDVRSVSERYFYMYTLGDTLTMKNYYQPKTIKPIKL